MRQYIEPFLIAKEIDAEQVTKTADMLQSALLWGWKKRKIDITIYLELGSLITSIHRVSVMMRYWNRKYRYDIDKAKNKLQEIHRKLTIIDMKYPEIDSVIDEFKEWHNKKSKRKRGKQKKPLGR